MRGIHAMLLALIWVAGVQIVAAQQAASMASPTSARAATAATNSNIVVSTEPADTAAMSTNSESPATAPANVQNPMPDKKHAKKEANSADDDGSKKSPYWDPKDWAYIYNQGP